MSPGRKPRHGSNLQTVYDQIQGKFFLIRPVPGADAHFGGHALDFLIKIKPKLSDIQSDDDAHVFQDLHHITSLAQSFSDQRLKLSKKSHLADALDQEGLCRWLHCTHEQRRAQFVKRCKPLERLRLIPPRFRWYLSSHRCSA